MAQLGRDRHIVQAQEDNDYEPLRSPNPGTEADPYGISPTSRGSKLDAGKAPVTQGVIRYFPRAIEEVAALSQVGAEKYTWSGWEDVPDGQNRYANARGRHELAIGRGEELDQQTGILHLTAVAWNALAELELYLREEETWHQQLGE